MGVMKGCNFVLVVATTQQVWYLPPGSVPDIIRRKGLVYEASGGVWALQSMWLNEITEPHRAVG